MFLFKTMIMDHMGFSGQYRLEYNQVGMNTN